MSDLEIYLLGVLTTPLAFAAFRLWGYWRTPGYEYWCPHHGWSSGDLDETPKWRARARKVVHVWREHRHGEPWRGWLMH